MGLFLYIQSTNKGIVLLVLFGTKVALNNRGVFEHSVNSNKTNLTVKGKS